MNLNDEQRVVQARVNELIYAGCNYELENLQRMYHDDLVIIILNKDGTVTSLNKEQNQQFFASKKESGAPAMSMEVEFKYIEVNKAEANVIVVRHIDLFETVDLVYFSLFLRRENNIWKVYRENAFII